MNSKTTTDPYNYVINLSGKPFHKNEYKLLQKNLNFVPNPGKPNKKDFQNDTKNYFRRVILKAHFGAEDPKPPDGLRPTSNKEWIPKQIHHSVQTYIQSVQNDLSNFEQPESHNRPNLSKGELEAMEALKDRDDIIISKADKGGGVVIQDVDDYVAEANRQLNNPEFYEKVDRDLTPEHSSRVNEAVNQLAAEGLISEKTAKCLHAKNARTPKFYMLPKVHKPNNPGRPIIAAIDSPTSNLARYIDHHLQPLAEELPSFIKDTGAFLRKIEAKKKVSPNSILVTMDISALYTNIPHKEGISPGRTHR